MSKAVWYLQKLKLGRSRVWVSAGAAAAVVSCDGLVWVNMGLDKDCPRQTRYCLLSEVSGWAQEMESVAGGVHYSAHYISRAQLCICDKQTNPKREDSMMDDLGIGM